ncbi:MAG: phosphoribosylformylglycinamidine synthase [Firmicutes bacterium]|nr:phosphoribosylformylglycinamidine synthase [Bacillota bacterium]
MVKRIFVEKRAGFDIPAKKVFGEITNVLKIDAKDLRIFIRYDIEGLCEADFESAVENVFSEPPCDTVFYEELPKLKGYEILATEFLKGQYDQRADSAEQCAELLLNKPRPKVRCATVYAISGINKKDLVKIAKYLINPTDSKEASPKKPKTLAEVYADADGIDFLKGFIGMSDSACDKYHKETGFAMSTADLRFVRDYFKSVNREPSLTEIKLIDTYWSDHCRHTTFLTELTDIDNGENPEVKEGSALYERLFKEIYKDRPEKYVCLMDIATIGGKILKKEGKLNDLDLSDEINACSIKVKATIDGKPEDWLVMFKNETHNHPTEIEPFGGAATCLGGAIRDPLSGRVYVYQAMRITGAGNVFKPIEETLQGKLPQRVISKTATAGFSSYGNQIGLATGIVNEVYHDKYVAKRLETGFVVGGAPAENVIRKAPEAGDIIILLGGETGRDGCGGATGSSKAHNKESVSLCGAEVQKGNPLTERKIQRFFRNKEATTLIKKCNDFGAGGVSVAIGELSEGLDIYLDKIPKKYKGLTVTETAISESQERMAVVVAEKDADKFLELAREENLEAVRVAVVTDLKRLRMFNKGNTVADIERSFLDTNGVKQTASVKCRTFKKDGLFETYSPEVKEKLSTGDTLGAVKEILKDKNVMLQRGQSETFDSTIGAGTLFMPFGGKNQLTPALTMASKLPTAGKTDTSTVCSWAFNAQLTDDNPFIGSVYAVTASVAKLIASGVSLDKIRLTLQEFFLRLNNNPLRFGEPYSALLGALYAQYGLSTPAIGGKDSMSGSYENHDVPNTLISFALGTGNGGELITNVFKAKDRVYRLPITCKLLPKFEYLVKLFNTVTEQIRAGNITSATVTESGGAVSAVIKSAIGNNLGVHFAPLIGEHFETRLGDLIIAVKDIKPFAEFKSEFIAEIGAGNSLDKNSEPLITFEGESAFIPLNEAIEILSGHSVIYPTEKQVEDKEVFNAGLNETKPSGFKPFKGASVAKPKVLIPVFPGTNCEYDTAKRFEREGAKAEILVVKNLSGKDIADTVARLQKSISECNIIAFPGGFSGGDEPDGSGKFIASMFRNPRVCEEVHKLLNERDGLILGICNGFQALVKLGLLPYGEIKRLTKTSPTLTYNALNRHISTISRIRIASNASPWLSSFKVGDTFAVPISHGEGRFTASGNELEKIIENNQIATQYVDFSGNATMVAPFNPNGSVMAIEGIISENGRILGKMGHSERWQDNLYLNMNENFDMNIFKNGVKYFK